MINGIVIISGCTGFRSAEKQDAGTGNKRGSLNDTVLNSVIAGVIDEAYR